MAATEANARSNVHPPAWAGPTAHAPDAVHTCVIQSNNSYHHMMPTAVGNITPTVRATAQAILRPHQMIDNSQFIGAVFFISLVFTPPSIDS